MREDVVQLARDPAALGDRRRSRLLLARVLELREQQLGPVLALACLLQEVRDQPEQRAQQRGGEDRRRGAARERRGDIERDRRWRHRARSPSASGRRATAIHTAATDREVGRALRLQRRERDAGGAHRRDHRRLQRRGRAR